MAKLHKIKRPAGIFLFDVELLMEDQFGVWLYAPLGSNWRAPNDSGTLPFDFLLLLSPERCWAAWWVDDPADKRLEIDICLPPKREHDGWSYIDLELDPVRHADGTIEIQGRDEFARACRDGWITSEDAAMVEATAVAMANALREYDEPLGNEGWRRLYAANENLRNQKFFLT